MQMLSIGALINVSFMTLVTGFNVFYIPLTVTGWICYAEKTLGSYILPYISSVKSPQQTIGTIVKQHLSQKMSIR